MTQFTPGTKVYVRTVTHHQVGEIVSIETVGQQSFLVLKNASWVADSGRWTTALKDSFSKTAEIEPFESEVLVNIGSIIDVTEWKHELPTKQQ